MPSIRILHDDAMSITQCHCAECPGYLRNIPLITLPGGLLSVTGVERRGAIAAYRCDMSAALFFVFAGVEGHHDEPRGE
jgi:hypothetical protein